MTKDATPERELKQQLADAILMMERARIMDFNGHISARRPGTPHFLINSGKSVRSAPSVADIVTIDLDGNPVDGTAAPPMEFHIHASIYRRRADVSAVAHIHPLWSTLLGMVGQPVLPVMMQAAVLGDIQRFGQTASINTRALGDALAETLGPHRVAVLRSHGAVVAAAGVVEAFALAVYLEETAQRQYLAQQIGQPQVLGPEELQVIARNLFQPHLLQKVWDYHHAKLGSVHAE